MITSPEFRASPYYQWIHNWVRSQLGRPHKCEDCGATDKSRYEWANISGEYRKDITDWKRLCKLCHTRFDKSDRCMRDHLRTAENNYASPTGGNICRECRREWQREYMVRYRAGLKLKRRTQMESDGSRSIKPIENLLDFRGLNPDGKHWGVKFKSRRQIVWLHIDEIEELNRKLKIHTDGAVAAYKLGELS